MSYLFSEYVTQETPTVSSHDSRVDVLENRGVCGQSVALTAAVYEKCLKYILHEDIPMKIMWILKLSKL